MKIYGSAQIPKVLRWKENELLLSINHHDNGELKDELAGLRYEADFTIIKGGSMEDAMNAFTRMITDPDFDQKVIDNIEISGKPAIETKPEYTTKVSTTIFPPLPLNGRLKKGEIYSYNNGAVMVMQDHERTIYAPEQTPALFSFWRDNASAELAWMAGEKVEAGWKRTFGSKTYECLQAHQTQETWTPDKTPALWKEIIVVVEIPVFVHPTGAHDVYMKGDKVHFPKLADPVYVSLIDNNSWSPTEYPAGWKKL